MIKECTVESETVEGDTGTECQTTDIDTAPEEHEVGISNLQAGVGVY